MVCEFTISRRHHAMCSKDGLIYLGGSESPKSWTASVEMFDPKRGSCMVVGALAYPSTRVKLEFAT